MIYDLRGCEKLFLLMHLYAFDYFVYISIPDLEFLKYGLSDGTIHCFIVNYCSGLFS